MMVKRITAKGKGLLNCRNTAQRGFSLVEVLIALFIFSLIITSLISLNIQQIRTHRLLEQKQTASLLADNQLAVFIYARPNRQARPPSRIHERTQMAGQTWEWELSSQAVSSGLYQHTIKVKKENAPFFLIERTAFSSSSFSN